MELNEIVVVQKIIARMRTRNSPSVHLFPNMEHCQRGVNGVNGKMLIVVTAQENRQFTDRDLGPEHVMTPPEIGTETVVDLTIWLRSKAVRCTRVDQLPKCF